MTLRRKDTCFVQKQVAWGTAISSAMFELPLAGDPTVTYNSGDFRSERSRASTAESGYRKGNYSYTITLQIELDASNSVFVWQNLLGLYAYSVDTPVASANQHVSKLAIATADRAQLSALGFTMEIGGDGKYFTYDSCIIDSVEIGEIEQGVVPMTVTVFAREVAEAGSSSGGAFAPNATGQLLDTLQSVISAGVAASEVAQPITVTSLSINRGSEPHFRASANTALEHTLGEFTTISGAFEIEVGDTARTAVLDDFTNSDELSIIMAYTSGEIVTGSTPYSLTIAIPECKYTSVGLRTDGHRRWEKYEFMGGTESGTDGDATTVTQINALTTFA
jgi:hypothetical protein